MRKLAIALMILLPVVSMAVSSSSLVNPQVGEAPPIMGNYTPLDGFYGEQPKIIVTGSVMFICAARYNHNDENSIPYGVNDQGLKLVEHCINYLLSDGEYDGYADPVTSATIACIGDFDGAVSGLQTYNNTWPQYDQDYMVFVEGNLNALGNSYILHQIDNSTALNSGSTLYYDILLIGEQWDAGFLTGHDNYLHSRAEFNSYLNNGGKVIIAGTTEVDHTDGNYLTFLPKDEIRMQTITGGGVDKFPLPPADPNHPIAVGINDEEWDIVGEVIADINYFDVNEYYKVFPAWSGTNYTNTLVIGGDDVPHNPGVEETTWGQIKAQEL
jgi:hypothetical protein